ncbi:phenylalanine--tRNA ligase subunit alpha [Coxiella endosymbiont of Amblyomma americanum]|uniref:phenylalanine--tRNA ligase subunit alpha n=1 Tax=Coxiella endosymbiont of Amblyomma americanum TaxID=325775 RepID=UPI000581DC88|nr:phenylalanine--tRNA ligase subunit alpha [Coxiella endosymbiont of Amblyomma americanum]AJC50339.1 phenylalanyl-tRNA synthetase [Coxiella endosymbiont of Amblyomma americanum]AUJ58684.1 phenylalanine--tRNA ligase subunit alpha [Coxiella-like endosymbiont of Amblyomma americanum]
MTQLIAQKNPDLLLKSLLKTAKKAIKEASDASALDKVRVNYLGKKGKVKELLQLLGELSFEERPKFGKAVNDVKHKVQTLLTKKIIQLQKKNLKKKLTQEKIDVTLRGRYDNLGTVHPITYASERIIQLFFSLGFQIAEGPEIEDEYHNFEALNIPLYHPARRMMDTFYFSDNQLLRTHTSNVQIRIMEEKSVPIQSITLGRAYRRDFDHSHTPMFHQVEGLVVSKQCTFSDLKGLLEQFFNFFFEDKVRLRFRPSYFPFTEPSAEVDIHQSIEKGWLEVAGCGMVHPNVLRNVNIDPDEYNGCSFGIGIDRLAMLRYGIPDLRLFFENDLHFLRQF